MDNSINSLVDKICFIICKNNDDEYEECLHYLNRLTVPDGMETDIMAVEGAASMTEGYNAAMDASDAGIKVYMHQDTFIINKNFIADVAAAFKSDSELGLLGVVGSKKECDTGYFVTSYDTGMVFHNSYPHYLQYDLAAENKPFDEVRYLDGLILITRGNVRWREDLFKGWDFYDISQCEEYMRAGYKVGVVRQEYPWVWHDNSYSKLGSYNKYRDVFLKEYYAAERKLTEADSIREDLENLKQKARNAMFDVVGAGGKAELAKLFSDKANRGMLHLSEFEMISDINTAEEEAETAIRLWQNGMSTDEVLYRLRVLKHCTKRIEFNADEDGEAVRILDEFFSGTAIEYMKKHNSFAVK